MPTTSRVCTTTMRGSAQAGRSSAPRCAHSLLRVRTDLTDRADIAVLVEAFYRRVFADELIGPIFTDVARMDLDHHLPVITGFWETVLFAAGRYRRNLLELHEALNRRVPLGEEHFARWLELWNATVDELFAGPTAEAAKCEARRGGGTNGRPRGAGRGGCPIRSPDGWRAGPAAPSRRSRCATTGPRGSRRAQEASATSA